MEPWQIVCSAIGLVFLVITYVETRVSQAGRRTAQVRSEAIDIADRNTRHLEAMALEAQKDAGQVSAFLREDFVNRAVDLKGNFEQLRRESRDDLKSMGESNEKFRAEMRGRLDEILREIRNGHGH